MSSYAIGAAQPWLAVRLKDGNIAKVGMRVDSANGKGIITAIDDKGFVSIKLDDGSEEKLGPAAAADALSVESRLSTRAKVAIGVGAAGVVVGALAFVLLRRK